MSHLNIKYVQETPAGHTSRERDRENSPRMITYTNFATLANILWNTSRERDRENSPRMITYTNFATLANILWTYLQQIYEA